MNASRLVWGIVLALIGGLLIATNLGYLSGSIWLSILSLWPLILIIWGLRLLIRNDVVFVVLSLILIGCGVLFVIQPVGNLRFGNINLNTHKVVSQQDLAENTESGKNLNFTANLGAVNVNIGALDAEKSKNKLYEVNATDMGKLKVVKTTDGDNINVVLSEEGQNFTFTPPTHLNRSVTILLSRDILVQMKLSSGASKQDLNFENVKLSNLNLETGASSTNIRLGKNVAELNVQVSSGAASQSFDIPKDCGVKITQEEGLSSSNLDSAFGFNKNGNTSTSSNYANSQNKVNITVRSGATSTSLRGY